MINNLMVQKKNILLACDSPRSLIDFRGKLIEQLLHHHNVSIFTPRIGEQDVRNKLNELKVQIFETDLNTSNVSIIADLKYLLTLYNVMRSIKPDVFFPYAFKPVIYGSIVARFCKVKSIRPMLTGLGYNYERTNHRPTIVQYITRLLLKVSLQASDQLRIILQNEDDYRTLLAANTITTRNHVHFVNGSGVDLSYYQFSVPDINTVSFLMISRLINAKGVKEYYEAAKIVKSKSPEAIFRLVGPYDDNIDAIEKSLFEKIKTDGTIEYLGLVRDVRPLIKKSSIVVLPSYYGEGVPRSILEALAMGRGVITSNSVGCKETVNKTLYKKNGFLIPIKNVKQLAFRMEYFIKYPNEIVRFGLNGRDFAREKFDVNKVNDQMIEILLGKSNLPERVEVNNNLTY